MQFVILSFFGRTNFISINLDATKVLQILVTFQVLYIVSTDESPPFTIYISVYNSIQCIAEFRMIELMTLNI